MCGDTKTTLDIPSFTEIHSGVLEPQGPKFGHSHYFGYWLLQQATKQQLLVWVILAFSIQTGCLCQ